MKSIPLLFALILFQFLTFPADANGEKICIRNDTDKPLEIKWVSGYDKRISYWYSEKLGLKQKKRHSFKYEENRLIQIVDEDPLDPIYSYVVKPEDYNREYVVSELKKKANKINVVLIKSSEREDSTNEKENTFITIINDKNTPAEVVVFGMKLLNKNEPLHVEGGYCTEPKPQWKGVFTEEVVLGSIPITFKIDNESDLIHLSVDYQGSSMFCVVPRYRNYKVTVGQLLENKRIDKFSTENVPK